MPLPATSGAHAGSVYGHHNAAWNASSHAPAHASAQFVSTFHASHAKAYPQDQPFAPDPMPPRYQEQTQRIGAHFPASAPLTHASCMAHVPYDIHGCFDYRTLAVHVGNEHYVPILIPNVTLGLFKFCAHGQLVRGGPRSTENGSLARNW